MYEQLLSHYKASWPGLVRIAAWTVLFLWLFGSLVHPSTENVYLGHAARNTPVIPMMTARFDPRQIRPGITPDPAKTHIAWIGDSTLIVTPKGKKVQSFDRDYYRLVPAHVGGILQSAGKDIDIPLYASIGIGPIDTLSTVLQALDQKPDMIVIALNPLNTLNNYRIRAGNFPPHNALAYWLRENAMRFWIPALASPRQLLWAALGRDFAIIRDAAWLKDDGSQPDTESSTTAQSDTPKKKESTRKPEGWPLLYNTLHPETALLDEKGWPLPQIPDAASFTYKTLNDTLGVLSRSGIPVLLYVSPISPSFRKDPRVDISVSALETLLRQKQKEYPSLKIIPHVPDTVVRALVFNAPDPFHLVDDRALDTFLAAKIKDIIPSKSGSK